MRIGYARVSKADDQDTRLQLRTLKQAGVTRIFEEKASGGRWDRPELQRMLSSSASGTSSSCGSSIGSRDHCAI